VVVPLQAAAHALRMAVEHQAGCGRNVGAALHSQRLRQRQQPVHASLDHAARDFPALFGQQQRRLAHQAQQCGRRQRRQRRRQGQFAQHITIDIQHWCGRQHMGERIAVVELPAQYHRRAAGLLRTPAERGAARWAGAQFEEAATAQVVDRG